MRFYFQCLLFGIINIENLSRFLLAIVMILKHGILQLPVLERGSKMADTSQQALSEPHTNGVVDGLTEDEKSKMRPADIDAVSFVEYSSPAFLR